MPVRRSQFGYWKKTETKPTPAAPQPAPEARTQPTPVAQPLPAATQLAAAQLTPAAAQLVAPQLTPAAAQLVTAPTRTQHASAAQLAVRLSLSLQIKRVFTYGILLLIGYAIWAIDGLFTVLGAMTVILPKTAFGFILGVVIHLFVSWGQHTFIKGRHPFIKGFGITLLVVNVLSNIYGLTLAARWAIPTITADLPEPGMVWLSGVATVVGPQPASWLTLASLITIFASLLAWYAEKIRDFFQEQWRESPSLV